MSAPTEPMERARVLHPVAVTVTARRGRVEVDLGSLGIVLDLDEQHARTLAADLLEVAPHPEAVAHARLVRRATGRTRR